ncbi:type II toxin-antitoxin system YafO family toxin [Serratia marcescens]|uniref:type II toxin-antitoxin system YafO family toxin n=1 Tax=Serratia marcescens TaxID=615 RepID=UPI00192B5C4F|nr:type II toxin-antitoxin system YafO family toxin [Serratia marcescens]MBL5819927.1 type II toxin-antitoxin system YafO family toxin [Serratia marcescens]
MAKVSITEQLCDDHTARHFATLVAKCLSNVHDSPLLGARGGFERNIASMMAGIEKFHIRMPDEEPWKDHLPLSRRTSNNYLVFARHCYRDGYYQILAIISPNAHQQIDIMLPALIELAEKTYIELSDDDLEKLEHFEA